MGRRKNTGPGADEGCALGQERSWNVAHIGDEADS